MFSYQLMQASNTKRQAQTISAKKWHLGSKKPMLRVIGMKEHTMTTSDTYSIVTAAAVLFVMAASTI